jgi:arylsulfatase A-like enzyme
MNTTRTDPVTSIAPTGPVPNPDTGAYRGFEGVVGRTFAGSQSWWPPRPAAREGAPNVIVMLVDDLGFSDLGCFGSEIDTPHLDRFAGGALRYTNFHVTPMCSPTRASLMTGLNSQLAGVGHVAHSDPGFPGYAMELAEDAVTMPEAFRANGYSTLMVGKWHLAKDSDISDAGPRHSWPLQRGFDRYYGFLDGFTNLHHPHRLIEDNSPVEVDTYPEGYFLTDDLTDKAISMIASARASNPAQPFFMYFAHGAMHAPLHAKAADIEKYRGRYDAGWDEIRARRFEHQRELGLWDEAVEMAPRNTEPGSDVRPWEDLDAGEQRLAARYMETFAGMLDNLDQNFGRLLDALERMGELDNTVILFTADNGASREGEVEGTTGYYVHLLGETDLDADLARIDEIGGPTTMPHYPRGWAMAGNTPFRLYKINTHSGGHRVPMMLSVPGAMDSPERPRRTYHHVIDVFPTLADLCGIAIPDQRRGVPAKQLQGQSFAPTVADSASSVQRTEQVYEMVGHRGMYRDGWEVVSLHRPLTPFSNSEYELYHVAADPTELHNLADRHPDRVAELAEAWETAAWANQIYPLDEGSAYRFVVRPPRVEVFDREVRLVAETPTLERWRSMQLIVNRSATIDIRLGYLAGGDGPGDEGVLLSHGDQGGGYLVWIVAGEVRLGHNDGRGHFVSTEPVAVGEEDDLIRVTMEAPGGGFWHPTIQVGDRSTSGPALKILFPMAPFEGITVGRDPRSPVSWDLYQAHGSFPYTGRIDSVTYVPGPAAPDAPVNLAELLRSMGAAFE